MLRNPFRDLDQKQLRRSSDALKVQNDYFKIVNKRIFIFAIIIVLLFSCIIVRLFFLQIRDQEKYSNELAAYSLKQESTATPRGQMYDRNGKLVVKTASAHNITYYPPENSTTNEKWQLAQKFAETFSYDFDSMTRSDYQDLYMFLSENDAGQKDNGKHLLEETETGLSVDEQEKLIRSRITTEMVDAIADEKTKEAFAVYLAMNQAPIEKTKVIMEDASDQDVAYLMEHKDDFPGFDVDFGSWKREYPYKNTLRDVLGSVTSSKQGVPAEEQDYYQALGYAIMDRVGQSGLEKQYEDLLRGEPKISNVSYDENGIAIMEEVSSGKKGYDLQLTIDIELQQAIDEILEDVMEKYGGTKGREKFDQLFTVLMNPKTGEIYSMNGVYKNEDDEIINFASGVYLNSYQVGSVAKGASVYMFLSEGVQTKTSTEYDEPMNIAGAWRSSYRNMGTMNAVTALENSSNVYMWKSVIKLAGGTYVKGDPLNISEEQTEATLELMRNYYTMFGLGTKTGMDIPDEASGYIGYTDVAGNLLDYAIGQFETYTPIQLAQYVSTIANGGYRVQPKLVNTATEINNDYTVYENKTKVLGTLNGKQSDLETVQEGFRACVTGNHCGIALSAMEQEVASKTGTAEVGNYVNATQIGYAPYDDPDVAFVCVAPTSADNSSSQEVSICTQYVSGPVLEEFFKKY